MTWARLAGGKRELLKHWDTAEVTWFLEKVYPLGHNATDYGRWTEASAPYRIEYEQGYEPWGIMHR